MIKAISSLPYRMSTGRNRLLNFNQCRKCHTSYRSDEEESDFVKYYGDENDVKKMSDMFPVLVNELAAEKEAFWLPEISERFKRVITYNIPDNKKVRALIIIETYKALMSEQKMTNSQLALVYLMAWCTEIHQTAYVMIDDILDGSTVRRHRPAWQVVTEREGNLELSYSDCYMLSEVVFLLLKKYFRDQPYYREVMESYHVATMHCCMGITFDTMMHKQINKFDENIYFSIAPNKTAHPMFILNVKLAFQMAQAYNEELWPQIEDIVKNIGIYHQIRNDYQGYMEDNKRGKPEEDIQLGQCTWFIVQALKLANQRQKNILKKYYGVPGQENASKVADIYDELNLKSKYDAYSKSVYENSLKRINDLPDERTKKAVLKSLQVTYGFTKQTFSKKPETSCE